MKHVLIIIVMLAFSGAWIASAPCVEASLDQAVQFFQVEKNTEALQAVQDYLRKRPDEPRGMFLHGLILERMGQTMEAMEVYQDLIRIHPEFPEPYNNLAGLLAREGRYEEAKEILQQALLTHPSYAAAHQNLSKIYSAMASQAYRRVLGAKENGLQVSLEPLEELSSFDRQTLLAVSATAGAPPSSSPPLTEEKSTAAETPVVPLTVAEVSKNEDPSQKQPVPEPTPSARVAEELPRTPEPSRTPDPVWPQALDLQQQMKSLLHEWAKAWANQDVSAYLSFYSSSFVPERGLSRQAWQEQRKTRVAAPPFINITLSEVTVTRQSQDLVQVHFSQHYRSNVINDQVRKEILFKKDNGQWRIIRERLLPR
ncbi:MAG TPA: tetratricopeptide repeat protein [Desulfonatronum sp.]|nr:tetratricopeptide repeat protein [Desulfonatronum sp.]